MSLIPEFIVVLPTLILSSILILCFINRFLLKLGNASRKWFDFHSNQYLHDQFTKDQRISLKHKLHIIYKNLNILLNSFSLFFMLEITFKISDVLLHCNFTTNTEQMLLLNGIYNSCGDLKLKNKDIFKSP